MLDNILTMKNIPIIKNISSRFFCVSLVLVATTVNAQQISLNNNYVLDPLQINLAYAGHGCGEANVHYRNQWAGAKDAPRLYQLNAHTGLGATSALGLKLLSQSSGLLNNLQATLGYVYRVKLTESSKLHFGLGAGFQQTAFKAPNAIVIDANDQTLGNGSTQRATGFDAEFGVMYLGSKLKGGIAILHLYNSNPSFSGDSKYKVLPQTNASIAYTFNKDKKIEVEPWLVHRYTVNGTQQQLDGLVSVTFSKLLMVGAGYRTNYGVLAMAGLRYANFKLGYSFDYGTGKNATSLGSSHQFVLGLSLCKADKFKGTPVVDVAPTPTVAVVEPKKEEVPQPTVTNEDIPAVKEEPVVKAEPKVEPKKEEVTPEPSKLTKEEVVLQKINGFSEEVVFDLNKAEITPEAKEKLDVIAGLLKDSKLKVIITGHTCDIGSPEYNKNLSAKRAANVMDYLKKKGVNTNQLKYKGLGKDKELFDNNSADKAKNRTVRFVIK